jgi:hypothetical protein
VDQRGTARAPALVAVSSPRPLSRDSWPARFQALPKAELHVHLEGTMEPATVVALSKNHGDALDESSVAARYATRDFVAFIEAYKWVTSYLRAPADYALVARRMCEQMLAQNVIYAEVTLSVGVMLLRKQDVEANYCAIREAAAPYQARGLRLQWIFDAVRQFGTAAAHDVAQWAVRLRDAGVVAFGMGNFWCCLRSDPLVSKSARRAISAPAPWYDTLGAATQASEIIRCPNSFVPAYLSAYPPTIPPCSTRPWLMNSAHCPKWVLAKRKW